MLRIGEFDAFDLEKKIEIVLNKGQYLTWKASDDYNIYLYKIDDFFAETWMHMKLGKILKVATYRLSNLPEGFESTKL